MREAVGKVLKNLNNFYPDRVYVLLFLCALLYIFFTNKKLRNKLVIPVIVVAVIVINPVLYKLGLSKLTFWRFFWIFSDILVISYVLTDLVRKFDKAWAKIIVCIYCAVIIVLAGANVFKSGALVKTQNKEHLDAHTKSVCDAMLAMNEHPKCVVPLELAWEARQYCGDIEMMYGRNADGFINRVDPACDLVQESIAEGVGYDYVFTMATVHGYPFVVTLSWKQPEADVVQEYNYEKCFEDDMYALYYNKNVDMGSSFEDALLIRYNVKNYVFYTFERQDTFVVISGDDCKDSGLLRAVIRSHGNHVDAWYKTGAENASGEYHDIKKQPQGAVIDQTLDLIQDTSYDLSYLESLFEGDNPDYYINYLKLEQGSDALGEFAP